MGSRFTSLQRIARATAFRRHDQRIGSYHELYLTVTAKCRGAHCGTLPRRSGEGARTRPLWEPLGDAWTSRYAAGNSSGNWSQRCAPALVTNGCIVNEIKGTSSPSGYAIRKRRFHHAQHRRGTGR